MFLAGRSAYLIFMDDFFLSRESLKATDTLVSGYSCPGFSNKGGNKKKVDNLMEWCCTQQN